MKDHSQNIQNTQMDLKGVVGCVWRRSLVDKITKGILHLKRVKTAFDNFKIKNMTQER